MALCKRGLVVSYKAIPPGHQNQVFHWVSPVWTVCPLLLWLSHVCLLPKWVHWPAFPTVGILGRIWPLHSWKVASLRLPRAHWWERWLLIYLKESGYLSMLSLYAITTDIYNNWASSLCGQLRGSAAGAAGILVCGVPSPPTPWVGVTLEWRMSCWGCLWGIMVQKLLWRIPAEVDSQGMQC